MRACVLHWLVFRPLCWQERTLRVRYGITAYPTFLIFSPGGARHEEVDFVTANEMVNVMNEVRAIAFGGGRDPPGPLRACVCGYGCTCSWCLQRAGTYRDINGGLNAFAGRIKAFDAVTRGFANFDPGTQTDILDSEFTHLAEWGVWGGRGARAMRAES